MFKIINENLDKFIYKPRCGMYRFYVYKNIKIGRESPFILFDDYTLYIDEKEVKLNILERWKIKRIYKKLEILRNNSYKNRIKSELINT